MKNNKLYLSLILIALIALVIVACNKGKEKPDPGTMTAGTKITYEEAVKRGNDFQQRLFPGRKNYSAANIPVKDLLAAAGAVSKENVVIAIGIDSSGNYGYMVMDAKAAGGSDVYWFGAAKPPPCPPFCPDAATRMMSYEIPDWCDTLPEEERPCPTCCTEEEYFEMLILKPPCPPFCDTARSVTETIIAASSLMQEMETYENNVLNPPPADLKQAKPKPPPCPPYCSDSSASRVSLDEMLREYARMKYRFEMQKAKVKEVIQSK